MRCSRCGPDRAASELYRLMADPHRLRPVIVWFRDDLRLSDHPALHAAAKTGAPVICLLCARRSEPGLRPLGGAARWWLAQSLRALESEPARPSAASLVLRQGPGGQGHRRASRARPRPERCSGTRSHRRRTRPLPNRSPRRWQSSVSTRKASPATCWWRPRRSATRKAAACGSSRRSGGGCWRMGDPPTPLPPRRRCVLQTVIRSDTARKFRTRAAPSRLGRRPARDLDARREGRRRRG